MPKPTLDTKNMRKLAVRPLTNSQASRKPDYLKRISTLKKKSSELATLCGSTVCMVCFGPDGKVETWPENQTEVKDIIRTYKEKYQQGKDIKETDLIGFLMNKKKKLEEKRFKLLRERFEKEILSRNNCFDGLSEPARKQLRDFSESAEKVLKERIKFLKEQEKDKETNISCGETGQNTLCSPNLNDLHGNNILDLEKQSCSYTAMLNCNDQVGFPNPNLSQISPWGYYPAVGSCSSNTGGYATGMDSWGLLQANKGLGVGKSSGLIDQNCGSLVTGENANNFASNHNSPLGLVQERADFGVPENLYLMGHKSTDAIVNHGMLPQTLLPLDVSPVSVWSQQPLKSQNMNQFNNGNSSISP